MKDGFEFFKSNIDLVGKTKQRNIVAIKELHGEYELPSTDCYLNLR